MIQMTLAKAANILGLSPHSLNQEFQGISIDTRSLQKHNLFVAISGTHVDGHDYLNEAYKKGAASAIVNRLIDSPLPQLLVKDTTAALGQLGFAWRKQFNIPFVAVTGSNGKTTLKNMIADIMIANCDGNADEVLATKGTLNNHWGLPLTLLALNSQHRYAVIEMGMNHFGEIEYLTKMTQPQVAIITNAAASHLEGLGNIAGVAKAKSEIFSGLSHHGMAVLNRDDAFYTFWREIINDRDYLSFGFHPDADIHASMNDATQKSLSILHTPKGSIEVNLRLLGKHNIQNALAAAAAALSIGIELDTIKIGLENSKPAPGRLELHHLANGIQLIDDTYNANPFSLQAAIQILSQFPRPKNFSTRRYERIRHRRNQLT